MPFVWIMGLLIFAYFTNKKLWRKRALISSAILFVFFSNSIIFDEFMRVWEVDGVSYQQVDHYDVGIVLGGMVAYNNDLDRLSFGRGSDRIMQAVRLYKMGKIKKIMICGDSGRMIEDGLDEAKQLKEFLVATGIKESDIITETDSKNTHENAEFAAQMLKHDHPEYSKFLLITSAFHMRRARACFENEGLKIDEFSTDHFTGERWFSFDRLFVPNIEVLQNWNILTKEWVGYIMYWMMGYV